MKRFESCLAPELNAYLEYRRALGYAGTAIISRLRTFDRYLQKNVPDEHRIDPAFLLKMREKLQQEPGTLNGMLSALRGFFLFLVRQGIYVHNPVEDIPPVAVRAYVPFVFSPLEIEQLLQAALQSVRKTPGSFLRDLATYVAVVLMARCGMRIREPLHLKKKHYRPGEGTLYIEKTKFKKDRLIPVPQAVLQEINNYLATRESLQKDDPNPYLLAGLKQAPIPMERVYRFFLAAVEAIGIDREEHRIGDITLGRARPHSLRHAFAINTMKRIRDQGKDPHHALPVLAAYMGHAKYQYTAAYLKVLDAENLQGLVDFAKSQLDSV